MRPDSIKLSRRHFLVGSALAVVASGTGIATIANAEKMNLESGVAIKGYDPVAYFSDSSAVKGDASITADYKGATYQFASQANKDAFLAQPAKFAPQYGGFCAYAVANGYTAPIDPQAFTVVDDKLYLNFSKGVRSRWERDIPGNIAAGDKNWPGLSAS